MIYAIWWTVLERQKMLKMSNPVLGTQNMSKLLQMENLLTHIFPHLYS
jgi:hypothetical protein